MRKDRTLKVGLFYALWPEQAKRTTQKVPLSGRYPSLEFFDFSTAPRLRQRHIPLSNASHRQHVWRYFRARRRCTYPKPHDSFRLVIVCVLSDAVRFSEASVQRGGFQQRSRTALSLRQRSAVEME